MASCRIRFFTAHQDRASTNKDLGYLQPSFGASGAILRRWFSRFRTDKPVYRGQCAAIAGIPCYDADTGNVCGAAGVLTVNLR